MAGIRKKDRLQTRPGGSGSRAGDHPGSCTGSASEAAGRACRAFLLRGGETPGRTAADKEQIPGQKFVTKLLNPVNENVKNKGKDTCKKANFECQVNNGRYFARIYKNRQKWHFKLFAEQFFCE